MSGDRKQGRDETDDKVVNFDPSRRRSETLRFAELAETARRLQNERNGAAEAVAALLDSTPREEWPRLAEHPTLRTSGALEQLAARLRSSCERDPIEALDISSLATTIAETLPPDSYPAVTLAQLRAHAWKDRAHTLRYLGRYDESLDAIAMAERSLEPFAATSFDKAVVALVKATTLQHVDRFEESQQLLTQCREVFRDHGDFRRYLYCGIAEVLQLYRQHHHSEARELGTALLSKAADVSDLESAGRLHNIVGYADLQLGNLRDANKHLANATAIFTDLGRPIEATRCQRGFGSLLLTKGHVKEGMRVLEDARRELVSHTLVEEAGLCGLTMAAAMLESRDSTTARILVRTIIDEFNVAGLNLRAVEAMEHLVATIETGTASPASVHHVQEYVDGLRRNPSGEFMPMGL
jgi:tetratricopeptide (TPR) repeat protein